MMDTILNTALGGILAILGGLFAVRYEARAQRQAYWKEKRFDLYCRLVEFFYLLDDFIGAGYLPLSEVTDITDDGDALWAELVRQKREIFPLVGVLFDRHTEERVLQLYARITNGDRLAASELDAFTSDLRKKYF